MISLEEQISGWYRLLRQAKQPDDLARTYQSLLDTVVFLAHLPTPSVIVSSNARTNQFPGIELSVGPMTFNSPVRIGGHLDHA